MGNKDVKILPAPNAMPELPSGPNKDVPKLQQGFRMAVPRILKYFKKVPAGKYFTGQKVIVPSLEGGKGQKGRIIGFDEDSDFYAIEMSEGPQKGQKIYRVSQIIEEANPPEARRMKWLK
jgi:hypothetical protein